MSRLLDYLVQQLSRSRRATRLAALVRNQADRVVQRHFAGVFPAASSADRVYLRALGPAIGSFVDVGANRGDWAAQVLEAAPGARGVLFEPGGAARAEAEARLGELVSVRGEALSSAPGEETFHEGLEVSRSSSFLAGLVVGRSREVRVQVTTLDQVLDELGWSDVLCKVDCEGWDLDVLRGARRSLEAGRIGAIQFEYNSHWKARGATLHAAHGLLESAGYELRLLTPEGLVALPVGRYAEYFSYSNYLALRRGSEMERLARSIELGTAGY